LLLKKIFFFFHSSSKQQFQFSFQKKTSLMRRQVNENATIEKYYITPHYRSLRAYCATDASYVQL